MSKNAINLDDIRSLILSRMQKLKSGTLTLDDFTDVPHDAPMYPTELQAEAELRGVWNQMERRASEEHKAVLLKREGNLHAANEVYKGIFRSEEKFDKPYIWSWCKVLILAKNFADLNLLLEYLQTFNVCYNLLAEQHNPNMTEYAMWGTSPERVFQYDGKRYLRKLCPDALATKSEVQQRFAEYGGSAYWQSNYTLNDAEYSEFVKYFGGQAPSSQPSVKKQTPTTQVRTTPAKSNSASSSSGCYVATYVYGSYDCPEVWTLRRFRDQVLAKHTAGRQFIRFYYAISPKLIKWFGKCDIFHNLSQKLVTRLVKQVEKLNLGSGPYLGQ